MALPKYHPHGSVLFVTFSIEEGLLLLSNPLCMCLLQSCLARAQYMHPVKICAFVIQANHVHMIIVVDNPNDVSEFIRYFKTESAHMINGILGREKRTVWCEGYDSPVVLTPLRTLIALTYIYTNPSKDNLVDTIDQFPGLSSWKMFLKGEHKKTWKRIRRPAFKEISLDSHNLRGYTKEAQLILSESKKTHTFTLTPNAWMDAFGITDPKEQAYYNKIIIERIRTLEERAKKRREIGKKKIVGRDKLLNQILNTTYRSKRSGKRNCCLSEDREKRVRFINFLKDLYQRAREVYSLWKTGDFSIPFPLGLYPPSMPKLAEPIGLA